MADDKHTLTGGNIDLAEGPSDGLTLEEGHNMLPGDSVGRDNVLFQPNDLTKESLHSDEPPPRHLHDGDTRILGVSEEPSDGVEVLVPPEPVDVSAIIFEVLPPYISEKGRPDEVSTYPKHPPVRHPRLDNIAEVASAVLAVRSPRDVEEQEEEDHIIQELPNRVGVPCQEPRLSLPSMSVQEILLMDAYADIGVVPSAM
jgi:hypothetical protein